MTTIETTDIRQLVERFDWHDEAYTPEVAESVSDALRENTRVAYSPAYGGIYILTHYEDVRGALRDWRTFSSDSGVHFPRAAGMPKFSPIDYDPPEQTRIRDLMAPPVTTDAVRDLRGGLADLAADLIQPMVSRGSGDLSAELAQPFAIRSLGLVFGLSVQAQQRVRTMTRTMWKFISADKDASKFWPAFAGLLAEEIQRVRDEPGENFLSRLVNTPVDGSMLDDDTLYSIIVSFCVAGHDNTMNALSRILWNLGRTPQLQRRLQAEPGLRANVIEETLRRWAPTDRFTRVTTRDVTIGDVIIPRESRVVLLFDAANRDPAKFPDPGRFDPDRANARQHVSFGIGVHHCLGVHLARAEFDAVLAELARHPTFHLIEEPARHFENGRHLMFDQIQVVFDGDRTPRVTEGEGA